MTDQMEENNFPEIDEDEDLTSDENGAVRDLLQDGFYLIDGEMWSGIELLQTDERGYHSAALLHLMTFVEEEHSHCFRLGERVQVSGPYFINDQNSRAYTITEEILREHEDGGDWERGGQAKFDQ